MDNKIILYVSINVENNKIRTDVFFTFENNNISDGCVDDHMNKKTTT